MHSQEDISIVRSIPWFHQIDLGGGLITNGGDNSSYKLSMLGLPENMRGLTVIDIGAWDGFFSFACEKRGAVVLSTDHICWGWGGEGLGDGPTKTGFDTAKRLLRSNVAEACVRVENLSAETVGGPFDIVLFLGVLYHAMDPLGYLRRVCNLTKGFAVIETVAGCLDLKTPALEYFPGASFANDKSNFFAPNEPAMIGMCQDVGFSRVEVVNREYSTTRRIFHAFK